MHHGDRVVGVAVVVPKKFKVILPTSCLNGESEGVHRVAPECAGVGHRRDQGTGSFVPVVFAPPAPELARRLGQAPGGVKRPVPGPRGVQNGKSDFCDARDVGKCSRRVVEELRNVTPCRRERRAPARRR